MLHAICLVIIMQMQMILALLWQIFITLLPPFLSFTILHQVQTEAMWRGNVKKCTCCKHTCSHTHSNSHLLYRLCSKHFELTSFEGTMRHCISCLTIFMIKSVWIKSLPVCPPDITDLPDYIQETNTCYKRPSTRNQNILAKLEVFYYE